MSELTPAPTSPARRGRGRGRGNFFSSRRGRGRGTDGGEESKAPLAQPEPEAQPEIQPAATAAVAAVAAGDTKQEEDDDKDVCFICASDIVHLAIAPCNHRTCHICSLRWRALYKTDTCAHCRVRIPFDSSQC
jgi:E3 ubiquitin-protein ligase ZNF598